VDLVIKINGRFRPVKYQFWFQMKFKVLKKFQLTLVNIVCLLSYGVLKWSIKFRWFLKFQNKKHYEISIYLVRYHRNFRRIFFGLEKLYLESYPRGAPYVLYSYIFGYPSIYFFVWSPGVGAFKNLPKVFHYKIFNIYEFCAQVKFWNILPLFHGRIK
jgi:hypothetical protein